MAPHFVINTRKSAIDLRRSDAHKYAGGKLKQSRHFALVALDAKIGRDVVGAAALNGLSPMGVRRPPRVCAVFAVGLAVIDPRAAASIWFN